MRASTPRRIAPPEPVHATSPSTTPAPAPVNISINVVVTDRRGRPLVDLKPADFQLDDNGVTQTLASVELRRAPTAASPERGGGRDRRRRAQGGAGPGHPCVRHLPRRVQRRAGHEQRARARRGEPVPGRVGAPGRSVIRAQADGSGQRLPLHARAHRGAGDDREVRGAQGGLRAEDGVRVAVHRRRSGSRRPSHWNRRCC